MKNKKIIEIIVLVIYTWLNIRIIYPFLFGEHSNGILEGIAIQSNGSNLLALFIGLFLNVAVILYWLKKNTKENIN